MRADEVAKQFEIAVGMRKAGDSAGALRVFEAIEGATSHRRDLATLRLFQAMCLTDLGRVDEAHDMLRSIDEKELDIVDQIDQQFEYARINRAMGMPAEALKRVERAITISHAVGAKERVEEASRDLQAFRGVLLAESGNCHDAVPVLQGVSTESPWWIEAQIQLGDCHLVKRRFRDAIESYLAITLAEREVDPIYQMRATRNIGSAYFYMGDYAKAVEYLTRVEHGYERNLELKAEVFSLLAAAYSHLGLMEDAARYRSFSSGTNSVQ
jgi:tetratricopeptide (TPR) repeat protein